MNNTKHINFYQFSLTYLSSFLGVGYVSGTELWEFFGLFGSIGYLGLIISAILLLFFGVIASEVARLQNKSTVDEIVLIKTNKPTKLFISCVAYSSMFAIFVIMTAGSGAILSSMFNINKILGSFLFSLLILVSVVCGINNIVRILTIIIPILIFASILICANTLNNYTIDAYYKHTNINPFLNNWFSSCIIYSSTNALAALGTIFSVAPLIKSRKHTLIGCTISSVILSLVGIMIIFTITKMPMSIESDLPMLYISIKLSDICGIIYSILLLSGMFSSALGNVTALALNIQKKLFGTIKHGYILSVSVICILGIIISNFGFSSLIKSIYPIIGYAGLPLIIMILVKYIYLKSKTPKT